jgi:chorismate mutase
VSEATTLRALREAFDAVDDEIIAAIAKRQALALEAGRLKAALGRPVRDDVREAEAAARRRDVANGVGADVDVVEVVFAALVDDSRRRQEALRR